MKIATRIVWDMLTGVELEREEYAYNGPVALCKGDNSKEEMRQANALKEKELAMMQGQLNMQQGQISGVNAVLDPIIKAGGMSPAEEAAMNSLAINQLPQDFEDTRQAMNTALLRRGITGGSMAGSGDVARNYGRLGAMEDYMKANLLSNIQLQKAQQLRQALGLKMGIGGMYGQNVGVFNSGAVNSMGLGVDAAKNADMASSSFWGSLFGGLGALGGGALGGWLGGKR